MCYENPRISSHDHSSEIRLCSSDTFYSNAIANCLSRRQSARESLGSRELKKNSRKTKRTFCRPLKLRNFEYSRIEHPSASCLPYKACSLSVDCTQSFPILE